jgi:hypothetical protein
VLFTSLRAPGRPSRIRATAIGAVLVAVLAAATVANAQRIFGGFYGSTPPRFPTVNTFRGEFNFCRAIFTSNRREKRGWDTDYPGAEINFSIRLSELTKTRVTKQREGDDAEYVTVRLTDDALFQCPFLLMEDAGTAYFSQAEIARFREYLQKGGFVFVSDYWGPFGKQQFDEQMNRVLPREQYPIVDLPMEHPIWHTLFDLKEIPQMPSIQAWRRSGGGNTDRGQPPGNQSARAVVDPRGRLMVVMIHDSDIPDGWEREGEDKAYFYRFSPDAYSVGIDVVLYGLTH